MVQPEHRAHAGEQDCCQSDYQNPEPHRDDLPWRPARGHGGVPPAVGRRRRISHPTISRDARAKATAPRVAVTTVFMVSSGAEYATGAARTLRSAGGAERGGVTAAADDWERVPALVPLFTAPTLGRATYGNDVPKA